MACHSSKESLKSRATSAGSSAHSSGNGQLSISITLAGHRRRSADSLMIDRVGHDGNLFSSGLDCVVLCRRSTSRRLEDRGVQPWSRGARGGEGALAEPPRATGSRTNPGSNILVYFPTSGSRKSAQTPNELVSQVPF